MRLALTSPITGSLMGSIGLHAAVGGLAVAGAMLLKFPTLGTERPDLEVWVAHSTSQKIRDSVRVGQAHAERHLNRPLVSEASQTLMATSRPARGLDIQYPESARRRGESGVSILQVEFDSFGKVESSELVQSSGSKDLDSAALESVKRLEGFPPGSRQVKIWFKLQ